MSAVRYLDLIEATLRTAFIAREPAANEAALPVDVALPAVADRLGFSMPESTHETARWRLAQPGPSPRIVDGAGHARSTYLPIVVRATANMPEAQPLRRTYLATSLPVVHALAAGEIDTSASNSSSVVRAVFAAWTIASLVTSSGDRELAEQAIRRFAMTQQSDGTFLARTLHDNPEPLWYDELALLHALSSHAVQRSDKVLDVAIAIAVAYHAAEVQPDHASAHPWAIAAFLSHPAGEALADLMLHAAGVQQPATMDAVSLLLLADVLDCGRPRARR